MNIDFKGKEATCHVTPSCSLFINVYKALYTQLKKIINKALGCIVQYARK